MRSRTRAAGAFLDGKSALMLAAARLRQVAGTKWGMRRYLDMNRLNGSERSAMSARETTFSFPRGASNTTSRSMSQQMCEKLWTLPRLLPRMASFPLGHFVTLDQGHLGHLTDLP